ncbi:DUF3263 domain-containing protein [Epidermidibacterium keratini]|uniref:DUF3263 domain-containing protein n=1 Tax=Epidermidibacterium keratini TaxID=1891644 RepID=A0A7L4YKN8_9ACTN|nr:DUF3263 domain-containing protein [Epidermidibacterium keratini]QHB99442.1 DUF3263 domain-containing protein [Epidermidibacterium keratini]
MLTERDMAILDIAGRHYRYNGALERDVKAELDMGGTHFFQALNRLLDDPDALAYSPVVVNRWRRQRVERQRAKDPRRLGIA